MTGPDASPDAVIGPNPDVPRAGQGPILVYVVSEGWYFLSHRLPMARAARDLGFRVIVATVVGRSAEAISAEGFEVVSIPMDRSGTSLWGEARSVVALYSLFRGLRPAIVHNVAIKPVLHGGLASVLVPGIQVINAYTGMGSLVGALGNSGMLRKLVIKALRWIGRNPRATVLVQNADNRAWLLDQGLANERRLHLIRGSGVDIQAFRPGPEPPSPPIVVLMVARLLSDKGVFDLIAAARTLRHRGRAVEIRLAGDRDPSNPNSLTEADIAAIRREGVVTLLGRRTDIAALWRQAHIAVLASTTGEGLPKSLLEAAASGVPIVTTDVPGCRDLVPKGRTGILVPPGDPDALADALDCLAEKPSARRSMGIEARQMVEAEFSDAVVRRQAMDLYRTVLDRGTQAGYGQSGEGERR